jgi:hypothetical protein
MISSLNVGVRTQVHNAVPKLFSGLHYLHSNFAMLPRESSPEFTLKQRRNWVFLTRRSTVSSSIDCWNGAQQWWPYPVGGYEKVELKKSELDDFNDLSGTPKVCGQFEVWWPCPASGWEMVRTRWLTLLAGWEKWAPNFSADSGWPLPC